MSYKLSSCLTSLFLILILNSCWPWEPVEPSEPEAAYRPVYLNEVQTNRVVQQAARSLEVPGKIYVYGAYLLINEVQKGIHIIDNRNPNEPLPISFIRIPGNMDMAVRNNILYADNHRDLIALDLQNLNEIRLIKRVPNAFPQVENYPPEFNVYYECVDPQKGEVAYWERLPVSAADNFSSKCFF